MCRIILMVILGWVVLLLAGVTVAAVYGPWWSVPLFLVVYVFATLIAVKWGIKRLLMFPFRMKGSVLRRATLLVNEVQRTTAAAQEEVSDTAESTDPRQLSAADAPSNPAQAELPDPRQEPRQSQRGQDENLEFFWIDVTINPRPEPAGGFRLWEPGEIGIVPHDADTRTLNGAHDDPSICDVKIWDGGVWRADDPGKYQGQQRVRFLVALPADFPRRIKLRYYFESFGTILLPDSAGN